MSASVSVRVWPRLERSEPRADGLHVLGVLLPLRVELPPALDGPHLDLQLVHDLGALVAQRVHALRVLLTQHLELGLRWWGERRRVGT